MSVLRAFNWKKSVIYHLQKCTLASDAKVEVKIQKSSSAKSVNIPLEPVKIASTTTVEQPVTLANDLVIKPKAILPPSLEKDALSTSVPFEQIPGPKIFQHFTKIWSFIPIIGNQFTTSTIQYMLSVNKRLGSQLSWGRTSYLFRWLLDEYGPIVRLHGPFGGEVVVVSRPEDALTVFASEGRYPIRSSLDCIEKYRLQYRRFKHAGPYLMFGEDWEKLRSQIEISLNSSASYQIKRVEQVNNRFMQRIQEIKNRQDEVPATFYEELCKWSLECFCAVTLGQNLGFMNEKEINSTTSEAARLLKAFHGATDAIKKCESGLHLWKFMETSSWKSLVKNCDTIDKILGKYVREAETNLRGKKNDILLSLSKDNIPLLETMLLQEDLYPEDILTVLLDMMLIGVNAMTHSTAFLLYHLARCPRAQRILTDEVKNAPKVLSYVTVSRLKYLQACIKESLRLKPPIPFLSRILTRDVIIRNYRIPKGTVILMAMYLSSTREEHFDDAHKFIPERWLNSDVHIDSTFACIPFGYGPKACLAKNLAEMQLSVLLIKILRNFKIAYYYGDIKSTTKMLATPDRPLKFTFLNSLN